MEAEEQPLLGQASQAEHKMLYNRKMMAFLNLQLDRAEKLQISLSASPDELSSFKEVLQRGRRLMDKHAGPFDIRKFYKVDVVHRAVCSICRHLKAQAENWQVDGAMELEDFVPQKCMEEDRRYLHKMLAYILKGTENDVDVELLGRWRQIKDRLEEDMKSLPIEIIKNDELVLGKRLGEGGYGVVMEAIWNSKKVAVKRPLSEDDLPIEKFACFFKEVMVHAKLHHPNVAQVYAATPSGWLVMELADSDLAALCHGKRLDWCSTRNILQQATKGLCYLHSLVPQVVHSDVKTSNLLIFGKEPSSCIVKVADFGLAVAVGKSRSKSVSVGQGTLEWMAPELFQEKPTAASSDVYSLGVVMYEVMTGEHPYGADKLDPKCKLQCTLLYKKMYQKAEPCTLGPEDCPEDMRSFMQRCISVDPSARPTMEEVSEWLQQLPANWSPQQQPADKARKGPTYGNVAGDCDANPSDIASDVVERGCKDGCASAASTGLLQGGDRGVLGPSAAPAGLSVLSPTPRAMGRRRRPHRRWGIPVASPEVGTLEMRRYLTRLSGISAYRA